MTTILETERLLLRTWTLDDKDLSAGLEFWTDPEVTKYVLHKPPENLTEIRASIERGMVHQEKYGTQLWAVVEKVSGKLIGCCGFMRFDDEPTYELVCHLAKRYWRQGYATEAAQAAIDYVFKELKVPKIVASAQAENIASKKILEKIGFRYVGMHYWPDLNRDEHQYSLENPDRNSGG